METFIQQLNLSEEQTVILNMTEKFFRDQIVPGREKDDLYPLTAFLQKELEQLSSLGLLRLSIAENLGGSALSLQDLNAALLGASLGCASFSTLLLASNIAWDTLATYVSNNKLLEFANNQKDSSLISYPLFYSPEFVKTATVKLKSGKINGSLKSMTLAPVSDFIIVPLSEISEKNKNNLSSLYLIPVKAKGLKVSPPLFMHGLRQCPFADVSFKNVKLEDAFLIGKPGDAQLILQKQSAKFTPAALSVFGGLAASSFVSAKKYMLEREQGGTFLIEKSVLQIMLSSLRSSAMNSLQSASYLTLLKDENALSSVNVLPALIQTKKELAKVAHYGIQLLGGYGYMRDYNQEKYFRDAISLKQIFGRVEEMEIALVSEYAKNDSSKKTGGLY